MVNAEDHSDFNLSSYGVSETLTKFPLRTTCRFHLRKGQYHFARGIRFTEILVLNSLLTLML
jgi:hypothetical protein